MKLTLEIADAVLVAALDNAGSGVRYWANDARRRAPKSLDLRESETGTWHKITPAKLMLALQTMAVRAPRRLTNFLGPDPAPDRDDCDLLCQYAIFGEAKYG